jgi:hypothetical protein
MMRRESGIGLEGLHHFGDLVDVAPVARRPGAPLIAVDRAKVAVGVGPLVPDADAVVLQVSDVGVALQEPEQLVDDGLEVDLLGGEQGKPSLRSKRIWWPNTEIVPVPVRSALRAPWSRTC